jgi:hypothetical protein
VVRRALGIGHDHHAEYDPDLLDTLPLARGMTPHALIALLAGAGFRRARVERMRDVEWARARAEHPLLGPLESVPRFAVVAEA